MQDISTCAVYTYTPIGVAIDHPAARALLVGDVLGFRPVSGGVATIDDYGTPPSLIVELDVDLGAARS